MSNLIFRVSDNRINTTGWEKRENESASLMHDGECPIDKHKPRLYLFLIGGSGASVMRPFVYLFLEEFRKSGYILTPVFLDRNFNSESVSAGILSIEKQRVYSQYMTRENVISSPFFFCEKNVDHFSNCNRLNDILDGVTTNDKVFISCSSTSEDNWRIQEYIIRKISQRDSHIHISICLLLPYFKILNDIDLTERKNKSESFDYECFLCGLHTLTEGISTYIVGSPEMYQFEYSKYQRNPITLVDIIAASSIVHASKSKGGYNVYQFTTEMKCESLVPSDVIKDDYFRHGMIRLDMTYLCLKFLNDQRFDSVCKNVSESISYVCDYLRDALMMIGDLDDPSYQKNPNLRMRLRKSDRFDICHLNRNFKKGNFLKHTMQDKDFYEAIMSGFRNSEFINEKRAIKELLRVINAFIDTYYKEISLLYY